MFKYKMSTVATVSLNSHLLNAVKNPPFSAEIYFKLQWSFVLVCKKKVVKNKMNTACLYITFNIELKNEYSLLYM